MIKNRSWLH